MFKTTVKIEGMMCGMCEVHINDAIRREFNVKKVSSSHSKKQTVILSENKIDTNHLKKTIEATGYKIIDVSDEINKKKWLFG